MAVILVQSPIFYFLGESCIHLMTARYICLPSLYSVAYISTPGARQ